MTKRLPDMPRKLAGTFTGDRLHIGEVGFDPGYDPTEKETPLAPRESR